VQERVHYLDVESVRDVASLESQSLLLGLLEVLHRDLHASLAQCQESRLSTDGLHVGSREVVLSSDNLVEVYLSIKDHLHLQSCSSWRCGCS
jgi:hypothetical protein